AAHPPARAPERAREHRHAGRAARHDHRPDHGVRGRGGRGPVAALGVPRPRHLDGAQRHRVRPHGRDPDAGPAGLPGRAGRGHRRAGRGERHPCVARAARLRRPRPGRADAGPSRAGRDARPLRPAGWNALIMRRRPPRKALTVNTDLKLMPLMNIIIALIPMLLLSAVFLEVKVIETSLPRDADPSAPAAVPATPPLDLAVHVRANVYVIEGHGVGALLVSRRPGAPAPDSVATLELAQALRAITAAHPGTTDVRIVAEARTRYQEVIALMDVARDAGLVNAALEGAAGETEGGI